jgi:hypothetical protein
MMVPLRMVLFPGETVLVRLRRPLWGILIRVGLHSLPPLALFAAVGLSQEALDRITEWVNLLPGFWPLVAGLAVLTVLTILPGYAFASLFSFDHWRVAITDRRVLLRHDWRSIRRDEMMRHDIENCLYDRASGKILLTGVGRELAIACNQRQAGRILAALGRDEATG